MGLRESEEFIKFGEEVKKLLDESPPETEFWNWLEGWYGERQNWKKKLVKFAAMDWEQYLDRQHPPRSINTRD